MSAVVGISSCIIPLVMLFIVGYGVMHKTEVYDVFTKGAKDGLKTVAGIAPTLIGLMTAVGVLRNSGLLNLAENIVAPLTDKIGFPSSIVPLALVKMFSSSAATGLLLDMYKQFGTDSFAGMASSLMLSCTETIFYTMSVYYMSVKIKKTRWTLAGAMAATIVSIVAGVMFAGLLCAT